VTTSWFLFFSYHNDARYNKHQIRIISRYAWLYVRSCSDWTVDGHSSSSPEHPLVFFIGFYYGKPLSVASFVVLHEVLLWIPVSRDVVFAG